MSANHVLQTERLILRPLDLADAPAIQVLASDRRVAQYTLNIPHPYPENGATEFIGRMQERQAQGFDDRTFAIIRAADQVLMGAIGIHPQYGFTAEIGYWIGVPYWNQGYMSEAARRVIQFGFEDLHLHRIEAYYFMQNPASGRVMQKAGMTFEGVMRQHYLKWGEKIDAGFYSILRGEFEAQQEGL